MVQLILKMIAIKNLSSNLLLRRLANLKFAISMLLLIGFLIAIGTFIEQDQSIAFYQTNYPENQPVFGFIDWRLIYFLNLNKIYTSYWFISTLLNTSLSTSFALNKPEPLFVKNFL